METDRNYSRFSHTHLRNAGAFSRMHLKAASVLAMMLVLLFSCSRSGSNSAKNAADTPDTNYHADNDIAMTMRSIIDAVKVGEPLDSNEYNFTGTLTDGTGRPLYTDIQGAPGVWEIKVLSPKSISLRNLYLGDLLPEELAQYILQSLQIPDSTLVAAGIAGNDPDAEVAIYDFGQGELIFETKEAYAENGDKGPLLNIAVRAKSKS